jgi:hypothetical protein
MKKTKLAKNMTISQFKAWLQGIVEFQQAEWVPNKEQWDTIYQKIQTLEDEPQVPKVIERVVHNAAPLPSGTDMALGRPVPAPSAMPAPAAPVPVDRPLVQMALNPAARPVIQKTGAEAVVGEVNGSPVVSSGLSVKTPNIDTSKGDYESGFS